jgi:predicted HicB family RNase H-like nuclease
MIVKTTTSDRISDLRRRVAGFSDVRNDRMLRMERKKTGRPSKGSRRRFTARLPVDLAEAATKRAAALGMTFNDYLGQLLAQETGVPYTEQEAIPTTAA